MNVSIFAFIRKTCSLIDLTNIWVGKIASYVIFIMVLMTTYEVIVRYVFNAPTIWSKELTQYGLCIITMLGGGYAILTEQHVRVDILYLKFPLKWQAAIDFFTWWLVILFCGVLIWMGGESAIDALLMDERSMGYLSIPKFPFLSLVVIAGFLMLLQAIARMLRNILTIITGQDEAPSFSSHH